MYFPPALQARGPVGRAGLEPAAVCLRAPLSAIHLRRGRPRSRGRPDGLKRCCPGRWVSRRPFVPDALTGILVSFQGRRLFVPGALAGMLVVRQGFSGLLHRIRDCGVAVLRLRVDAKPAGGGVGASRLTLRGQENAED